METEKLLAAAKSAGVQHELAPASTAKEIAGVEAKSLSSSAWAAGTSKRMDMDEHLYMFRTGRKLPTEPSSSSSIAGEWIR